MLLSDAATWLVESLWVEKSTKIIVSTNSSTWHLALGDIIEMTVQTAF